MDVSFQLPSDHAVVTCTLAIPRPRPVKVFVNHRQLHDINTKNLANNIQSSSLILDPKSSLDDLVDQYNTSLKSIVDVHAPMKNRWLTLRPHAPWYNNALRAEKREKRRKERRWRCTHLEVDKQIFQDQCKKYQDMVNHCKMNYYKDHISSCDNRTLFAEVDKLSNGRSVPSLPSFASGHELATSFSDFFSDKVQRLIESSQKTSGSTFKCSSTCQSSITEFSMISTETVTNIISKSSSKSCSLDPIPTCILKSCLPVLATTITNIVNLSLSTGHVPPLLKTACVVPRLKKKFLDPDELSSYRPISNLPFLSKTLERVVAAELNTYESPYGGQFTLSTPLIKPNFCILLPHRRSTTVSLETTPSFLNTYLTDSNLFSSLQSPYRRHHSVETALLRVANEFLVALDNGNEVLLVLLDYTAAFDT